MNEKKLISEMYRLVVRIPDSLKERIEGRAKANNRSVNSEVIAMLEQVLDGSVKPAVDALVSDVVGINMETAALHERLQKLEERKTIIEIALRAEMGLSSEEDPVAIAMRRKLVKQHRSRKDGHSD